ncbi:MAG: hypothetical protein IJC39_00555, partial [Firmicutes bacterium]|nr:hypothetical protein [Bacillota bacterium]
VACSKRLIGSLQRAEPQGFLASAPRFFFFTPQKVCEKILVIKLTYINCQALSRFWEWSLGNISEQKFGS